VLNKLEIDVTQLNELVDAVNLAVRYNIPALIINQSLIGEAFLLRIARNGKFKIISPVDWSKGDNYGLLKLRGMTFAALSSDGFEILLTPNKSPEETEAEASALIECFKHTVSRTCEVRFVLHVLQNEVPSMLMYNTLLNIRRPSMVRTDIKTKTPMGKHGTLIHNEIIRKLKSMGNLPIKSSGNFTSWRSILECNADRIAVSLTQLETIIKDYHKWILDNRES